MSNSKDWLEHKLLPAVIFDLLARGVLDRSKLSDVEYVWSVILDAADRYICAPFGFEDRLASLAREAFEEDNVALGVGLVLAALEYRLISFYGYALAKGHFAPASEIEQMLRGTLQDKLDWLCRTFPDYFEANFFAVQVRQLLDLKRRLDRHHMLLTQPRDTYALPSTLRRSLNVLSTSDQAALPALLEQQIEAIVVAIEPDYQLAQDVATVVSATTDRQVLLQLL